MIKPNIIEELGFDRAVSIHLDASNVSNSQYTTIEEVNEFGIDEIYFCTDKSGNSYPAIFLKKVNVFDEGTLEEISTIHKKIWNYKKVIFLYVYSETEIRIYNCAEKPLVVTQDDFDYAKELKELEVKSYKLSDKEQLEELHHLFSSIAIDTGIIWTVEEAYDIRKKIRLQRRVDKYLVDSLIATAKELQSQGLELNYIHKIIMRSLFLLYLEDRNATTEKFYSKIKKGAKSYFDILDDVQDTYALFEKLEDYFNGNVFTLEEGESELIDKNQLQLIKKCFISGTDNTEQLKLFENWRLFDFSIIQIELLSEIYESFLTEINPDKKQKTGTYYTPPSLVELILNEKLPVNQNQRDYKLKVLDPSCGSGIFLVESFKRLVKRYENEHNEKLTRFSTLKQLLTDNIYGIELDAQSIKVTAFSLYLALVDRLNSKTVWQNKNHRLPYLINNPDDSTLKVQGKNLFCRDTIRTNADIEKIEFDLVVGNPPFGTKDLLQSIRNYTDKESFPKEMVIPFLHKATKFSPNGDIALIFNTKVLTNTGGTYQNFRKWLFNECYVEKVYNFSILRNAPKDFGGQLFGSATGPISIIFYKKEFPKKPENRILYYAPKTFIKSNVIEGVSIDSTDVKYLPREECQKPDTKIWKIAMWGGMADWLLIDKILNKTTSLASYIRNNSKWNKPIVGLNGDRQKQDFIPDEILNPKAIERYYTPDSALIKNKKIFRQIAKSAFEPPFVIFKKGQHKRKLTASYIDYFAYCTTSCYVFNGKISSTEKKLLVSVLNSKITTYFLFMTGSSWGIEREQIFKDEVLESPNFIPLLAEEVVSNIEKKFDKILEIKKTSILGKDISDIEEDINRLIINEGIKLSKNESVVVNDCINYGLNLFENQEKSIAFFQVKKLFPYVSTIRKELNNFLENQDLYANITTFQINNLSPLMMVKISFEQKKKKVQNSKEAITDTLKKIDKQLWEEKATNIYFRKKLNYKTGNDVYLIRPNQRRFWSQSIAIEDASELILEILNEV